MYSNLLYYSLNPIHKQINEKLEIKFYKYYYRMVLNLGNKTHDLKKNKMIYTCFVLFKKGNKNFNEIFM